MKLNNSEELGMITTTSFSNLGLVTPANKVGDHFLPQDLLSLENGSSQNPQLLVNPFYSGHPNHGNVQSEH